MGGKFSVKSLECGGRGVGVGPGAPRPTAVADGQHLADTCACGAVLPCEGGVGSMSAGGRRSECVAATLWVQESEKRSAVCTERMLLPYHGPYQEPIK